MLRTFKFRIYPSKAQEELLNRHLWIEKELWNEMLAFAKEIYRRHQKFPTRRTLRKFVKNSGLYSQAGQELVDRLLEAIWRMATGRATGFPRFKSIERMKSLLYPQSGFSPGKKLAVTPFGGINIRKHRKVEGTIKTLTLKREASGKWFAIFCVEQEPKLPKANNGGWVGVDLGLMTFAALSDGELIRNPRHLNSHEDRLAFFQRKLSTKKKGSNNRRRAKLRVAKLHEKVANTRLDFLHKTANRLLSNYSLIAMEELASQEMAMDGHGKGINDAGWGTFANILRYKAEEAGAKVVFVDPENTSKECSGCGQLVKKHLWERWHNCSSCGLSIDRDVNAAKVILARATVGTTGSNASGDAAMAVSMKEDAMGFSPW